MIWIKTHLKLVSISIGALVLLIWIGSITGTNRKFYNMALNNLREDKTAIVQGLEQDQKEKAKTIAELQNQVKDIQRKRLSAEAESQRLTRLVNEKNNEIVGLKKDRDAIIIPTNPDVLADEFRKRGYRPTVILPPR
jgi:peptidoglycan hydrolase CwlO-like protein